MRLRSRIANGGHAENRLGENDELLVEEKLGVAYRLECRDRLIDRIALVQRQLHIPLLNCCLIKTYQNFHQGFSGQGSCR